MDEFEFSKCPFCGKSVDEIREMLHAPAANRWIPCSEMLPEYGLDVLVYTKSWKEHIQVAHIQYDGIMWELSDGEFYFSQSDVSHWMPLPEPPEVTQDD